MTDFLTPGAIKQAIASDDNDTRMLMRAAFRRSLYVWTKVGVCWNEPQNLMDADTFKYSCDWIQDVVCNTKRGLLEEPRGCIKSTRSTRAVPGWVGIQRPDERYDHPSEIERARKFLTQHPHIRGADSRLVIGSDSKERASDFVGSTKTDWEMNVVIRWAYPELLWENYNRLPYGEWSQTGYTLNSRINTALPDPFLTAVGLDSKVQGGRAEGVIIDDLVGETSYRSAAELERRKAWIKTVGYLLENRDYKHPDGGFMLVVGNRWSLDDVNSMIHNEMHDWQIWHRSAYRCIVHLAGNCGRWDDSTERACADSNEPLWKGRYPDAESLERVERDVGSELFAAQFRNDPTAEAELNAQNFRYCNTGVVPAASHDGSMKRQWAIVIPHYTPDGTILPDKQEAIALAHLGQSLISIDPASSKDTKNARTAISWFEYDAPTDRVFWLECVADHFAPEEAVEAAYKVFVEARRMTGRTPRILVEKVALQAYFAQALKHYAQTRRDRVPEPEMIAPSIGIAKEDRIRRRFGNRLNQGKLYLREGLQLPKWETRHFPTGTMDCLDTEVQAEEIYLNIMRTVSSDRLAQARKRKRARRIAAADRTGVPL